LTVIKSITIINGRIDNHENSGTEGEGVRVVKGVGEGVKVGLAVGEGVGVVLGVVVG
jgi:hypothetical protein